MPTHLKTHLKPSKLLSTLLKLLSTQLKIISTHIKTYFKFQRTFILTHLNPPWTHLNPFQSSVADPWHFGVDPDPDPRIHASD